MSDSIDQFLEETRHTKDVAIASYWLAANGAHSDTASILASQLIRSGELSVVGAEVAQSLTNLPAIREKYPRLFEQPQSDFPPEPESKAESPTVPSPEPETKRFVDAHPEMLGKNGLPRDFESLMNFGRHKTIAPGSDRNPSFIQKWKQRKSGQGPA